MRKRLGDIERKREFGGREGEKRVDWKRGRQRGVVWERGRQRERKRGIDWDTERMILGDGEEEREE